MNIECMSKTMDYRIFEKNYKLITLFLRFRKFQIIINNIIEEFRN